MVRYSCLVCKCHRNSETLSTLDRFNGLIRIRYFDLGLTLDGIWPHKKQIITSVRWISQLTPQSSLETKLNSYCLWFRLTELGDTVINNFQFVEDTSEMKCLFSRVIPALSQLWSYLSSVLGYLWRDQGRWQTGTDCQLHYWAPCQYHVIDAGTECSGVYSSRISLFWLETFFGSLLLKVISKFFVEF